MMHLKFKTSLKVQNYHKLQQIMHSHSFVKICPVSVFSWTYCLLPLLDTNVGVWFGFSQGIRRVISADPLGTRLNARRKIRNQSYFITGNTVTNQISDF